MGFALFRAWLEGFRQKESARRWYPHALSNGLAGAGVATAIPFMPLGILDKWHWGTPPPTPLSLSEGGDQMVLQGR